MVEIGRLHVCERIWPIFSTAERWTLECQGYQKGTNVKVTHAGLMHSFPAGHSSHTIWKLSGTWSERSQKHFNDWQDSKAFIFYVENLCVTNWK